MAKITYSKLDLKNNIPEDNTSVMFNGQTIEVKQYLPIEKKLELISKIINQVIDENGYYNPCRLDIYATVEVIFAYTNISFTDKQKNNVFKLYDELVQSGLSSLIIANIPESEISYIRDYSQEVIKNIYNFKNSALGILESISSDYSNLDYDATVIQQKLADPDNLNLLKDVLTKLG